MPFVVAQSRIARQQGRHRGLGQALGARAGTGACPYSCKRVPCLHREAMYPLSFPLTVKRLNARSTAASWQNSNVESKPCGQRLCNNALGFLDPLLSQLTGAPEKTGDPSVHPRFWLSRKTLGFCLSREIISLFWEFLSSLVSQNTGELFQ